MSSSRSQNSDESPSLLKILASVFSGVLFGLFLSKFDTPTEKDRESVHPKDNPRPETALGSLQVPITTQVSPAPAEHYHPDRRKDNTPRWKKWTEIAAVGIAGGLLVANGFVTVGTWEAANSTKDSVRLARKNAHFDQRAWLGFSFGTYKYAVNQPLDTAYTVTDTGKTPARNVKGMVVTSFMKNGERPIFNYEHGTAVDFGTMHSGIPQGATSYLISSNVPKGVHVEPTKVSEQMFHELQSGTGYILVYGKLDYDSIFGAHHWIKFCQSSGPTTFTHPKECVDYNDVDNSEEP